MTPVAVDAARFRQLLANLLENALTYTERGGKITLSAKARDDQVVFTVADTGIGIPPEYQPYVFNKFFRVPGQSEEGGTGLGLALAREIVAAHGGAIQCRSEVGAGSIFEIALPVWKTPASPQLPRDGSSDTKTPVSAPKIHA